MKLLKWLKVTALGLGACLGLGCVLTSCFEDPEELDGEKLEGNAERCCVGLSGNAYEACIEDYQSSSQCNVSVALYGVPSPDPIIPGTKPAIEECCGDLTGAEYEACVEDYKAVGSCNMNISDPEADVYGPPPVNENDEAIEECCGDLTGAEYEACVKDYKAVGSCNMNISDPEADVYGPPPFEEEEHDEAIEECCGDLTGAEYEACVEDYKAAGLCDMNVPLYGVPEGIQICCGHLEGESYDACVKDYQEAGKCTINATVYGPLPDDGGEDA